MVKDVQVCRLRRHLAAGMTLQEAAVRAGMDVKTARKHRSGELPSRRLQPHGWRTRVDPFADVWEAVTAQLTATPTLQAKTVFAWLRAQHPGRFQDGQLRTLQRRIKTWRALSGPDREVFFAQVHEPGRLGASDFTHLSSLHVTIGCQHFEHLAYHFVLTYSNWEHVTVCFSESFESLSEGLQNALGALGGVPARHRTDRMSLAVNNASDRREFTARYQGLLGHYGLVGEKTQAGRGNENGDVEQSHRRFKEDLDQALALRGSRDFASRSDYEQFLTDLVRTRNAGRQARLAEERPLLGTLPARQLAACKRLSARVDSGSLIHVDRNVYSVPARLLGARVDVRLFAERLEVWYAQTLIATLPRLLGRQRHRVDYRHVIDGLVRKPGAFERYRYKADLFPTSRFRMAHDALLEAHPQRGVARYLELLQLAAREGEGLVDGALAALLARPEPLSLTAICQFIARHETVAATDVAIEAVDLSSFDRLLDDKEVCDDDSDDFRNPRGVPARVALAGHAAGL